jgi:hypothetical protein
MPDVPCAHDPHDHPGPVIDRRSRPTCVSLRCKRDQDGNPTPRLAADGLRLCTICTNMVGEDALVAAVRYRQCGLVLTATGAAGEKTSGSKDPNTQLNLRAAAARRDIQRVLSDLAVLICHQRGFTWPTEVRAADRPPGFIGPMPLVRTRVYRLPAVARFVATSAQWLAAHEQADDHAQLLRELATGDAYRVAFPSGVRKFVIRDPNGAYIDCPKTLDGTDLPCPGVLWTILRPDDGLPSEWLCNHDEQHFWPASEWIKLGKRLRRQFVREEAA